MTAPLLDSQRECFRALGAVPGFFYATGFSGQGFLMGPAGAAARPEANFV